MLNNYGPLIEPILKDAMEIFTASFKDGVPTISLAEALDCAMSLHAIANAKETADRYEAFLKEPSTAVAATDVVFQRIGERGAQIQHRRARSEIIGKEMGKAELQKMAEDRKNKAMHLAAANAAAARSTSTPNAS